MSGDTDIWLADAARVFAVLRPADDAAREAIAHLLGLTVPVLAPVPVPGQPADDTRSRPSTRRGPAANTAEGEHEDAGSSQPLDSLPLLAPVSTGAADAADWQGGMSMPQVTAEHLRATLPHDPLLAPRSAGAVIHALLARDAGDGPVDIAAIVDAVARLRPLREIPHEPRMTLRFGAQLLLDVGDGMEPFLRDEEMFAEQVRKVAGPGTQVAYFADCPLRGTGPDSFSSWGRYCPPHRGTPVLVVSDFGIGGPVLYARRSRLHEWVRFAQLLGEAECPVAGLVPYPPTRWPDDLAVRIRLLTWDRGTTVGEVFTRTRGD